jgi:lantibiotic modifying enzyme
MSSDAFLDATAAIGRDVAADAVWHDGVCSWVGVAADPKEVWQPEYRALEPNLYDGTAGVGLFLAQLAAVTGDPAIRRTAVGALRHAVARAPAYRSDGFHAGSLGIAWAAARAAALLGEPELEAGARSVVATAAPVAGECSDVLLGRAGSALARLALDTPVEAAVADGEALLARATRSRHGWSWAAPGARRRHHLCGLSHGAAGIGWALLELYAATGDDRFREGAEGAFAYERSWLDAETGTWPDLREGGRRRGGRHDPSATAGSWCHGEAGIALTRLRAAELLGPEPYAGEAATALETTRRRLAAALPYEIEDMTLCHGLAGAADVLLAAGEAAAPAELGHVALERYGAPGARWPCGMLGGTTPNLFRGLTGIGWFYLRLHDPAIPSPVGAPGRLTAALAEA